MTYDTAAARRMLPVIIVVSGMGVLAFSVVGPALPDLAADLGVSRGAIGLVQGAVAIPGIFLAVFIGYLADRYGRRQVILGSLVIFGAAGVACFFLRSFWPLVAVRAVQGLGTSGLLSLGAVLIGDLFPEGYERQRALGYDVAGITLTALFAPIVGGLLAEVSAFAPFLVFALAVPIIPLATRLPGRPTGEPTPPPIQHLGGLIRTLRRDRSLVDFMGTLPFSLIAMISFAGFGFATTPLFLEREFGAGPALRGVVQASLSVGSSTASLNSGRIVARLGRGRVLTLSLMSVAAGFVVLAVAPTLAVVPGGLVLLGVGIGAIFPVLQSFPTSAGGDAYRGVAVGTWVSSIRLGQAVGPVIGTALADGYGERAAFGIGAVVLALVAAVWRPARNAAKRLLA